MIRRNHIDSGSIDRRTLKARPRQLFEDASFANRQIYKVEMEAVMDQNNRMVNHKKYHQYKDWKQTKTNLDKNDDGRQQMHVFAESIRNQAIVGDGKLKREYQYNSNDNFKGNYDSIAMQKLKQPKVVSTLRTNNNFGSVTSVKRQINPSCFQTQTNNFVYSHNVSVQNKINNSPDKKRANYSSVSKVNSLMRGQVSNSKSFKPLFSQNDRQTQPFNLLEQNTSNKFRNKTVQKTMNSKENDKYSNENRKYICYPATEPKDRQDCQTQIHYASKCLAIQPVLRQKQQVVSDKLKMISEFNDQINQRIKNIITCFEGLKNKL